MKNHLDEWLRPWKLFSLACGIALLIIGAEIYQAPDWDVPISLIMAFFTYLTAPISLRIIIERDWKNFFFAIFWIYFSVDGCYAIYWHFKDPMALALMRDVNAPASLVLYMTCGLIWLYRGTLRQFYDFCTSYLHHSHSAVRE